MSGFPMVIAHRGASSIAPENTLPAFTKAIEMGCDGIELDVHPSKDGYVMVIHDEDLDRTTNGTGLVTNYTMEQLKALDASKLYPGKYPNTTIPTLEEVFQRVLNTKLRVTVELKGNYEELPEKVVALIHKFNLMDRVVISSYNQDYLTYIKAIYPDILTEIDFFIIEESPIKFAKRLKVDVLCGDYHFINLMCWLTIKRIKLSGLMLLAYTVDEEDIMKKLIKKGIDGIMTNRPDILLSLKKNYKS